MLVSAFPKLRGVFLFRAARLLYRTPLYPAFVALITALSEIFGLELYAYYCYAILGGVGLLMTDDAVPLIPLVVCGYMTLSAKNNPGHFSEGILFTDPAFLAHFFFVCGSLAAIIIGRLVLSLIEGRKRGMPALFFGFLFLGLAYILGGLGSGSYSLKTALFGALQIVVLSFFYFYFYYTVEWDKLKKSYVPYVFLFAGLAVLAEIAAMYLGKEVTHRTDLFTGWGIYNNVGGTMAILMPAPFYFAATRKNGWAFTALGIVYFLGIVFTQSRGSIVFGSFVFLLCLLYVLIASKKSEKWKHAVVMGAFLIAILVVWLVFREKFDRFFATMLQEGFGDAGRFDIYRMCWDKFVVHPFFGVGFYETPGGLLYGDTMIVAGSSPEGAFIPLRAHNTVMQLIATGGSVALISYLFHRLETLVLFFRRPTAGKIYAAIAVSALLLTSLVDCHFFNLGPALLYSVLLAYAESEDKRVKAERTTVVRK